MWQLSTMLSRTKFMYGVLSRFRTNQSKFLVRSLALATKNVPRPLTLCVGSMVVYAASSPSNQNPPLTLKEMIAILKKADDLFNENKSQDVLDLLRPYKDHGKEEIIWRISRAAYTLSKSKTISKSDKNALVVESYDMAKLTLEMNEHSAVGHKWMSIALDAYSHIQGFRTRCSTLVRVKDHMAKSIQLDPSDATVIYMLGMWYYSIAEISWYQRRILEAIVGSPLSATFDEALIFFKKAEETSPNFYSLNLLMLGKCHLKLGDRETAVVYLQRAMNYPKFTDDDHQAHQEASELLKTLKAS